jgi:hypothetical protein
MPRAGGVTTQTPVFLGIYFCWAAGGCPQRVWWGAPLVHPKIIGQGSLRAANPVWGLPMWRVRHTNCFSFPFWGCLVCFPTSLVAFPALNGFVFGV